MLLQTPVVCDITLLCVKFKFHSLSVNPVEAGYENYLRLSGFRVSLAYLRNFTSPHAVSFKLIGYS